MKIPTILLVDDNADMRETIRAGLLRDGYAVTTAARARDMMDRLKDGKPDAILLDLILPDGNGLELMSHIRECTDAPVIVISGKNDMVDKIVGLEMGADDYLGKPFQMKELSARIKAQLRRYRGHDEQNASFDSSVASKLRIGRWILDRARLQVFDDQGASVHLTVKEIRLLEVFIAAPNQVLSREQLLDRSRQDGGNVTDRAIDTQIVRIRKKLGAGADDLIQSVRGAGYILAGRGEACGQTDL